MKPTFIYFAAYQIPNGTILTNYLVLEVLNKENNIISTGEFNYVYNYLTDLVHKANYLGPFNYPFLLISVIKMQSQE